MSLNLNNFDISWDEMKSKIDEGNIYYHHLLNGRYEVYSYREPFTYRCRFRSKAEISDFEDNYLSGSNKTRKHSVYAENPLVFDKGVYQFDTIISHDWTNKHSWPSTDNSLWVIEPQSQTKQVRLVKSEVQFSHDVILGAKVPTPGEFYFDLWFYNPAFDPGSAVTPDNPLYVPGETPGENPLRFLYKRTVFGSIRQVFDFGNDHYTMMASVDGINAGVTTVRFNYDQTILLRGDLGAQIRFSLKDHSPMLGDYCTVSVVIREEDIE